MRARWLGAAVASMRRGNGKGASVLRGFAVSACTNVSGLGLGGYLDDMLLASKVVTKLDASKIAPPPGRPGLIESGVQSSNVPTEARWLTIPSRLCWRISKHPRVLAGVAATQAGVCMVSRRRAEVDAAIIGHVEESSVLRVA